MVPDEGIDSELAREAAERRCRRQRKWLIAVALVSGAITALIAVLTW